MKTAQEISQATGGYLNPVPLNDIPGVRAAFDGLLARVQALPFVPSSWSADVKAAMSESGGTWQPRYAIQTTAWRADKTEPLYPDMPTWITQDQAAAVAWNKLTDWWAERLQPILAGWARSEAEVLNAANADAKFFSGLYTVVAPVAAVGQALLDAPAAAAEVVSTVAGGVLKNLFPVLLVVGVLGIAVLILKNKITAPSGG